MSGCLGQKVPGEGGEENHLGKGMRKLSGEMESHHTDLISGGAPWIYTIVVTQ